MQPATNHTNKHVLNSERPKHVTRSFWGRRIVMYVLAMDRGVGLLGVTLARWALATKLSGGAKRSAKDLGGVHSILGKRPSTIAVEVEYCHRAESGTFGCSCALCL